MDTARLSRYALTLLTFGLLIGCTGTPQSTAEVSANDSSTNPENTSEPNTSDTQLTTENTNSQAVNPEKIASNSASNLSPGRYCYQLETDTETIHLRLEINGNNQVYGDSRASIHNQEASYYTSYAQTFSGTLTGHEAILDITTWIEYDVQSAQQTWTVSEATLKTDQEDIPGASCDVVDQAFQDVNGLAARDLLDSATAVHNQTIRFTPGTSSATVSNSVIRGERDLYTLGAQGGQQMSLSISSTEDNAVFDVVSPSGYVLAVEATTETILLPHSGEYQVIVGGTRGNATYELTVGIE